MSSMFKDIMHDMSFDIIGDMMYTDEVVAGIYNYALFGTMPFLMSLSV